MIGEKEITTAIDKMLAISFPEVSRNENDVGEELVRPLFTVNTENIRYGKIGQSYTDDNLTMKIKYFPKEPKGNKLEFMEIERKLVDIFRVKIQVDDNFVIPVDDIASTISDEVLMISFDLRMIQDIEENLEDVPLMEDLNFTIS